MSELLRGGCRGRLLRASVLALPAFVAGGSWAAAQPIPTTVETVTVTAEKRSEDLQSVPMSISAFSGDVLEKSNITDIQDLAGFVPSLSITSSNSNRNTAVVIRNVGTSGTNPGTEPDVGVFIDDVFIPVAGPIFTELTDIADIEVLRGPQGTLYGRNTPVGAVKITTRAPSQQTEAYVNVEVGNFDERRVTGYIGGGLTEDLAGRLSLWTDTHSGYEHNIYTGVSVNDRDQYGGRARLRWTPGSDTAVDLIAYYARIRANGQYPVQVDPTGPGGLIGGYCSQGGPYDNHLSGSAAGCPGANGATVRYQNANYAAALARLNPIHPYIVPGPWQVDAAEGGSDQTDMWGTSIAVNENIPAINATLTDVLAYNSYLDNITELAAAGLPQDIATDPQRDLVSSTSNELRLTSSVGDFLDYVAGVYLFHDELRYDTLLTLDSGANRLFPPGATTGTSGKITAGGTTLGDRQRTAYHQLTNAAAVFGQVTIHLTDAFRILGGLRYSYDHKNASNSTIDSNVTGAAVDNAFLLNYGPGGQVSGRLTNRSVTYLYGAQYDVTKDMMLYATAGTGFKDGGFNSRSATATPFMFNPETTLDYEIGLKSTWFDKKLLVNADVYRMLLHGFQQSTLNPLTGVGFVINNAGNFREQGVEADVQARPIEELTLTGNMSFSDSLIEKGAEHLACDTTYPYAGAAPPPTSGQPTIPGSTTACDYDGLTTAYSPKWRWGLTARWEQPWSGSSISWYVQGSVTYRSAQYLDTTLDPRTFQGGFALVNAMVGIEPDSSRWGIDLWGKNLTNKMYFITEAVQPFAASVSAAASSTGTVGANGFVGWYGAPRTYGIEANYRF